MNTEQVKKSWEALGVDATSDSDVRRTGGSYTLYEESGRPTSKKQVEPSAGETERAWTEASKEELLLLNNALGQEVDIWIRSGVLDWVKSGGDESEVVDLAQQCLGVVLLVAICGHLAFGWLMWFGPTIRWFLVYSVSYSAVLWLARVVLEAVRGFMSGDWEPFCSLVPVTQALWWIRAKEASKFASLPGLRNTVGVLYVPSGNPVGVVPIIASDGSRYVGAWSDDVCQAIDGGEARWKAMASPGYGVIACNWRYNSKGRVVVLFGTQKSVLFMTDAICATTKGGRARIYYLEDGLKCYAQYGRLYSRIGRCVGGCWKQVLQHSDYLSGNIGNIGISAGGLELEPSSMEWLLSGGYVFSVGGACYVRNRGLVWRPSGSRMGKMIWHVDSEATGSIARTPGELKRAMMPGVLLGWQENSYSTLIKTAVVSIGQMRSKPMLPNGVRLEGVEVSLQVGGSVDPVGGLQITTMWAKSRAVVFDCIGNEASERMVLGGSLATVSESKTVLLSRVGLSRALASRLKGWDHADESERVRMQDTVANGLELVGQSTGFLRLIVPHTVLWGGAIMISGRAVPTCWEKLAQALGVEVHVDIRTCMSGVGKYGTRRWWHWLMHCGGEGYCHAHEANMDYSVICPDGQDMVVSKEVMQELTQETNMTDEAFNILIGGHRLVVETSRCVHETAHISRFGSSRGAAHCNKVTQGEDVCLLLRGHMLCL